jgi:hypothetical protein
MVRKWIITSDDDNFDYNRKPISTRKERMGNMIINTMIFDKDNNNFSVVVEVIGEATSHLAIVTGTKIN